MLKIKLSLVNFIRMGETVAQMATGCLRMIKIDIFALGNYKCLLVGNEKDGTQGMLIKVQYIDFINIINVGEPGQKLGLRIADRRKI